jgi:hypothetical protein
MNRRKSSFSPEEKRRRARAAYLRFTERNPLYAKAALKEWRNRQRDEVWMNIPERLPNGELPYEIKLTSCKPLEEHERADYQTTHRRLTQR